MTIPRVDGLSTGPPGMGRHSMVNDYLKSSMGVSINIVMIPTSQLGIRA